jgi:hypothetical protein
VGLDRPESVTPTPPPTGAFTISGQGSGLNSYTCNGISEDGLAAITISAQGQEDGTVTGSVFIQKT